jgi:hypothetical protein
MMVDGIARREGGVVGMSMGNEERRAVTRILIFLPFLESTRSDLREL